MNKRLILFIAYKACDGNDYGLSKKSPHQYRNALNLIGLNLFIHIIQLLLFATNIDLMKSDQVKEIYVVVFLLCLLTVFLLMKFIFPKKVLAKAISQYKGSNLEGKCKLIGFGYLFFNFILALFIAVWNN